MFSFCNLRESKKTEPLVCMLRYTYTYSMHNVHTCAHTTGLSGLVSSVKLQTVSFIMVKRMCAGHSDSFTYTAAELGPTLLVFLAFENSFFFKQNLSDSYFGWCCTRIVFNPLSQCMLHWTLFLLHSSGLFCSSLVSSAMLWCRFVCFCHLIIYFILFYSIAAQREMCTTYCYSSI